MFTKLSVSAVFLACANAHGHMQLPGNTSHTEGWELESWYTQGTWIGCDKPTGRNCGGHLEGCCENPSKPTLRNAEQTTYQNFRAQLPSKPAYGKLRGSSAQDTHFAKPFSQFLESDFLMKYNPWFAPGHAPIANPCGILGGWRYSNASDYIAGPGAALEKYRSHLYKSSGGDTDISTNTFMPPANLSIPVGTKGTNMLLNDLNMRMQEAQGRPYRTNDNARWKAGAVQEVSYTLVANHGGGMQYRLCPLDNLFSDSMTEDCFQSTPLDFVGDMSWFEYSSSSKSSNSSKARIPFTAVRVNDANSGGVLPFGSTWTKIGLPACAGDAPENCSKPLFENELTKAGFWGFSQPGKGNSPALEKVLGNYQITDKVRVPEGLGGDYVVSWRWDSEQTAQVWTQCSVVTIEA